MLATAPEQVKRKVHIVTLPDEADAYRSAYPWAKVVTEKKRGIGPARMQCLKDADKRGYQNIVVLDDDIIHVSLLERISKPVPPFSGGPPAPQKQHPRRYSSGVSGIPEPLLLVRSLAVACRLAGVLFDEMPQASYGAARNALFSGDVDTSIGATLNKGSFPACVMFFDVKRFDMRIMPKAYHYHGEDLVMFLDALTQGQEVFTLPVVAYDQHGGIETTIPLDPLDAVGRPHLQTTVDDYPDIHPYLRVSMKNKLGGTMRIGMNWKKWYADTQTEPVEIPLVKLTRRIL